MATLTLAETPTIELSPVTPEPTPTSSSSVGEADNVGTRTPSDNDILSGTSWVLVNNESNNFPMPMSVIAIFGDDGSLGGTAGCNSYTSLYELDRETISINEPLAGPLQCHSSIMKEEADYLATLAQVVSFDIDGDRLTLFDDKGEKVLQFEILVTPSLAGTKWKVAFINDADRKLSAILDGTILQIEFGVDGSLNGSAGCSPFTALYTDEAPFLTITNIDTANDTCSDPAGIMDQEAQFLGLLAGVADYQVMGDRLQLFLQDRALAASLIRDSSVASGSITPEIMEKVRNATYPLQLTASDRVTLVNGEFIEGDQSVTLSEPITSGVLANNQEVVAVILATDPGWGTLRYDLAVWKVEDGRLAEVSTTFLDDRVQLTDLTIEEGQIIVKMITQGPEDPLCCPTLPIAVGFELQNGKLIQTNRVLLLPDGTGADPTPVPQPGSVFLQPMNLARSYAWQLVPATTYDNCCGTIARGSPAHTLVTFDGDSPQVALADGGRRLLILPLAPYRQLWETNGDGTISLLVERLQRLLSERAPAAPGPAPLIPPVPQNNLALNLQYLDFEGGSGIRFISSWAPAEEPVTNRTLNYTFQGLTDDGLYVISFSHPVSSRLLADTTADIPAEEWQLYQDDLDAYRGSIIERLSEREDGNWQPGLSQLDELIRSLVLEF